MNEFLYRNNQISSNESSEASSDEELYNQNNKVKYGKAIFNFFIDSSDRNWYSNKKKRDTFGDEGNIETTEEYIKGSEIETFDFRVKFGCASNSIENTRLINPSDRKRHFVSQKFYGEDSLSFQISIKNIESIQVSSIIFPKRLFYLGGASYCNILDFRYLLVCLEEIPNTYYGTNNNINNAIAILYPLSVIYDNDTLKHVEFVEKGGMIKKFYPTPLNSIDNLRFVIKDPNGNLLKYKDDILNIKSIEVIDVSGVKYIEITTKEYFNQEYKNGDIIKIKNFIGESDLESKLLYFINRDEGHKIYIETAFTDTTHETIGDLQNTIRILPPGDYEGSTYTIEPYISDISGIKNATMGEIINTNLQISLFLKIESKIREFEDFVPQII